MNKILLSSIIVFLALVSLGLYIFFSGYMDQGGDDGFSWVSKKPQPKVETGTVETIKNTGSWWDPTVMRTDPPINVWSGVTVTVTTNWPPVRAMTPEELDAFQKEGKEN
jgi:hypothetical protein